MTTQAQIDAQRAQAMAKLFLARHQDVTVFGVRSSSVAVDPPVDLIASVRDGGSAPTAEFGVEVQGYRRRLPTRRLQDVVRRTVDRLPTMPLCLFCIESDKETGLYTWMFEPVVDTDGSASLRRAPFLDAVAEPDFRAILRPITADAVDELVQTVVAWARASSRLLVAS